MSASTSSVNAVQQTIRHDVLSTGAYVVANAQGLLKLDAMENPYELPSHLREELAIRLSQVALNRYPAPTMPALEAALRQATEIPPEAAVLFGNGSDELIDIIIRACCMPNDVVMAPIPTFVMYAVSARWAHARFVGVDTNPDFSIDLTCFLQAVIANQPKVIFLAWPNNPTGVALQLQEIEAIIQAAPGLVVVDEAYEAFADQSFMTRVLNYPNVLVLRTLSKQGLAGIRLGYAVASQAWIEQLDKVRPPYNINVLTRAVAEFVLAHHTVLKQQADLLCDARTMLKSRLDDLAKQVAGMEVFDSYANFLLLRVPNAPEIFESLKKAGILIKHVGTMHPLLANCLRVTVSTPTENQSFLDALKHALQEKFNLNF